MQLGTSIANLFFVGLSAFIGLLFAEIVKEKGAIAAAVIFGLGAFLFLLKPKTEYAPGEDGPEIFVTSKTFTKEETVHCFWRVYDSDRGEPRSGWCIRQNNQWYRYINFDDAYFGN